MAFNNPFKKDVENNPEVVGESKTNPDGTPKKTDAELLAETVSGALNAALKPVTDAIAAVGSRVEAVEQRFAKKPAENAEEPPKEPQYASVFDDEDAAIGQRVVRAVGPLYQMQLETQAKMNFGEVKEEYVAKGYGEVLSQFVTQINQMWEAAPLLDSTGKPYRGDKAYIRRVINTVFGEAAIAAGLKFGGKDKGFFIESAGGAGDPASGFKAGDGLTEGQRKIFARMKVSPDEAKKTVGKLKFIN